MIAIKEYKTKKVYTIHAIELMGSVYSRDILHVLSAYSEKQALFLFHKIYGYKNIRDIYFV